jgi:putative ATPase
LARDEVSAVALRQQAAQMNSLSRPLVLNGRLANLPDLVAAQDQGEVRFDVVIGRNALTRQPDKAAALRMVTSLLNPGGRLALGEVVPQHAQRLYALVDLRALDEDIRERLIAAEEAIYINPDDPMVNWDVSDLEFACQAAGLSNVGAESVQHTMQQRVGTQQVAHWFATGTPAVNGGKPTYALHLARYLSEAEISQVQALYERQLGARVVAWTSVTAYLSATKGQTHPDQHPAAPNG